MKHIITINGEDIPTPSSKEFREILIRFKKSNNDSELIDYIDKIANHNMLMHSHIVQITKLMTRVQVQTVYEK